MEILRQFSNCNLLFHKRCVCVTYTEVYKDKLFNWLGQYETYVHLITFFITLLESGDRLKSKRIGFIFYKFMAINVLKNLSFVLNYIEWLVSDFTCTADNLIIVLRSSISFMLKI